MEFQNVIAKRRMVRNFTDQPIPPATVDRILRNATHAPSAGFSQGWGFLVLDTPKDLDRFWRHQWPDDQRSGPHTGIIRAPVVIVPCSNKHAYLDRYAEQDKGWTDRDEQRWPVPYWHIDAGFASMLMLLTAVDENLGAVFFGLHFLDGVRETFGIPDAFTPIGAIALGHPAPDTPSPSLERGRRGLDDVVHRGNW